MLEVMPPWNHCITGATALLGTITSPVTGNRLIQCWIPASGTGSSPGASVAGGIQTGLQRRYWDPDMSLAPTRSKTGAS
jgi:hypothetical protein